MRVDSLTTTNSHLILQRPVIRERGGEGVEARKALGEAPPIVLDPSELPPHLAQLYGPTGVIERLSRRLNYLKRKQCVVKPAKGKTACVDDRDVVYLGIGLLEDYADDLETIAGVMAHEWGHACALKPDMEQLQELNWNQIFDLRRAHETLADETSGRLLYLMGYQPDGLIQFLKKGRDTHNLKYHHPDIREQVIRYGFSSERRKGELSRQLFDKSSYGNDYSSFLLNIV